MLCCLLLQAGLLSPLPSPAEPDADWRATLERLAGGSEWPLEEIAAPAGARRQATLQLLLEKGSPRQVRLAALLAAGAPGGSPLARACLRAALASQDEATALACLLAPAACRAAEAPALAWLAAGRGQPLSVRAAAAGRLLETGWTGAWPLARSILRAGTPIAEDAPWADWPRTGRYELPKRLLLVSVRTWLARRRVAPTDYEPNAAWADQVAALARLEELAREALEHAPPPSKAGEALPGLTALLRRAGASDRRARKALLLLAASVPGLLREAAAADPVLAAEAQAVAEAAAALL